MGMFDEVRCNHELFGVHKGEKHQTKNVNKFGGALEEYEITPSGRLEFLEYTIEDRGDPTKEGLDRLSCSMTTVFTGDRHDMNYHGWLDLSCFGRAKFTDGMLVAVELEQCQPCETDYLDDVSKDIQDSEESGVGVSNVSESAMKMKRSIELAAIAKKFCDTEMPSWEEIGCICRFALSGHALAIGLAFEQVVWPRRKCYPSIAGR